MMQVRRLQGARAHSFVDSRRRPVEAYGLHGETTPGSGARESGENRGDSRFVASLLHDREGLREVAARLLAISRFLRDHAETRNERQTTECQVSSLRGLRRPSQLVFSRTAGLLQMERAHARPQARPRRRCPADAVSHAGVGARLLRPELLLDHGARAVYVGRRHTKGQLALGMP